MIAAQGKWIQVRNLGDASKAEALRLSGLDRGESEALVLAQGLRPESLLLDDTDAVRQAAAPGLNVIRTVGIYRLAKQKGLIRTVAPKLDALRNAGFWLRDDHYRIILKSVDES